jgi:hypothetical protein
MKFREIVSAVAVALLSACAVASQPGLNTSAIGTPGRVSLDAGTLKPGTRVDLTGQWLFKPSYELAGGEKPEQGSADDATYRATPVPQLLNKIQWWLDDSEDFKKWEAERLRKLGFDTTKSSDGWYRLWVDAPKLAEGQHLWVEFDGVAMRSTTYVNGQKLGEHAGMFSRFGYDLTPHLKAGKNLLAVHVAMEGIPDTDAQLGQAVTVNLSAAKVISMSKGMFGPLSPRKDNREYDLYGIWQPVKLVVRGGARIDDVFFQPSLDGAKVDVWVGGGSAKRVRATLTDRATGKVFVDVPAREVSTGGPTSIGIQKISPKLWTPAEPNLYRLDVTIEGADGAALDTWSHNVGFRTFEAKGNRLLLNRKPYWLRGANQLPYGKNPFSPELARTLITHLKQNNINSTRTHCTPWNEAWLEAADEIGLGVSIEGIRPWAFAGRPEGDAPAVMPPDAIFEHWMMENEDVVKRCRNHPSVLIFTVGNEMLLRDPKSLPKWKLMSRVVKQTRELAGGLPVVASSDHVREPELYETFLKPNGLDDGDVDDMHKYFGWYSDSPFIMDMTFKTELARNGGKRPIIGQEISTGYPDLDTGYPVWRYTRDLVTPLAWVGRWSYPDGAGFGETKPEGVGPETFLEHNAVVTKRLAERMRWESHGKTAGFSLFSAECWFSHSYDPATVKPYPVVTAAKEFWAPIGLALETSQRRLYGGGTLETNVFITNDDEQFRDHKDLRVTVQLVDPFAKTADGAGEAVAVASLPYYETVSVAVSVKLPDVRARKAYQLLTRLASADGAELSRTTDVVEVFPRAEVAKPATVVKGEVDLSEGSELRKKIEGGATVILMAPGKGLVKQFADDILDVKANECEYADLSPVMGTALAKDLRPMDVKWWSRKGDWKCFVASQSHRLKEGGRARSLIDHTPSHSYIPAEKVPEQFRTVLFEIPLGQGRLWVCDLDLDASAGVDPAADLVMRNLHAAAGDKASTQKLPALPSHEQALQKVGRLQW